MKLVIKTGVLGILQLFAILVCQGAPGGKVTLKLKLEPGITYNYALVADQEIEQNLNDKNTLNQTFEMDFSYKLAGTKANGDQDIKLTYTRIRMAMKAELFQFDFDTDHPDTTRNVNPMALVFGSMKGESLDLMVGADGKIRKVMGMGAMMNHMLDRILGKDSTNDSLKNAISSKLKPVINDSIMAEDLQSSWNIYPDRPLKVGDSWTHTKLSKISILPIDITTRYTVTDINKDRVSLSLNSTITTQDIKDTSLKATVIKMDGTQSGTMEVEKSSGNIIKARIVQDFFMNYKMEDGTPATEHPFKLKSTTTITRL